MRSKGLADGGIYHPSQPHAHAQFRANTARQETMVGVALPQRISCRKCGQRKPLKGSKFVTPKHPRDGRICADCKTAAEPATGKEE